MNPSESKPSTFFNIILSGYALKYQDKMIQYLHNREDCTYILITKQQHEEEGIIKKCVRIFCRFAAKTTLKFDFININAIYINYKRHGSFDDTIRYLKEGAIKKYSNPIYTIDVLEEYENPVNPPMRYKPYETIGVWR